MTADAATDHRSVAKVRAVLLAAGMTTAAEGIRMLGDEVRTATAASEAVGVEPGAIANSLVFAASFGEERVPLLALTSGAHRADTARLAELIGAEQVGKAEAKFVSEHTGQVIGGVAPVGHPEPIRTIVDSTLAEYPVIWAAAGHPKSVYPTTLAELVALTGGTEATVA